MNTTTRATTHQIANNLPTAITARTEAWATMSTHHTRALYARQIAAARRTTATTTNARITLTCTSTNPATARAATHVLNQLADHITRETPGADNAAISDITTDNHGTHTITISA